MFLQGFAQDVNPKVKLKFNTRFDFEAKVPENKNLETVSSFDGKFLNIMLDGNINEKFSYSYRQRMIVDGRDGYRSFFNATDWIYLTYNIDRNFYISGGKQVVAIGGYEYDYAPIDVYFWSEFWNNVTCYQFGTTIGYKSDNQKHNIGFQISNSPFAVKSFDNIYSYNLIWYGDLGFFKPIYSINMVEHEKGHFINYISLGNKLIFNRFSTEIDYMNRASFEQKGFFTDFTLISKFKYDFNDKFSAFIKAGYDQNKAQDTSATFVYDKYVSPGVEYLFYGAGLEYLPLKNKNVKIHAFWATNNNEQKYNSFNVGLHWQMNVLER